MRTRTGVLALLSLATVVGCEGPAPVQPVQHTAALAISGRSATAQGTGKPEIDPTYANGKTVYMIGPHMIVNARETQPNLYAHAQELYLVVYPQSFLPAPGAGPITLPSGYQPQCDPCFHPGLPAPFVYHDHVITGAPGMGTNGTAGEFKAPWKLILVMYDPAYAASPDFKPVTSAADLDAAEAKGGVFVPINSGGANPYEIETGNVLICPIASKHA